MRQAIMHIALVVRDYDEAIAFSTQQLHFVAGAIFREAMRRDGAGAQPTASCDHALVGTRTTAVPARRS